MSTGRTPGYSLHYPLGIDGVDVHGDIEDLATSVESAIEDVYDFVGGLVLTSGAGDVAGPASSTDNAVVRFNLTTGKIVQDSGVTIDDSDNLDVPGTLTVDGTVNGGTLVIGSNTTVSLSPVSGTALRRTAVGYQTGGAGDYRTLLGYQAGGISGATVTALGCEALWQNTGNGSIGIGYRAGNALTSGTYNTIIGTLSVGAATSSYQTTLGYGTTTTGAGAVAIGVDSGGSAATASTNQIALGTANHTVSILGDLSVGADLTVTGDGNDVASNSSTLRAVELGGTRVKRNQTANGYSLFEVENGAGTTWLEVYADGETSLAGTTTTVGVKRAYREVTTTDDIETTDHIINCTSGTFTVTLPAAGDTGREYVVKNSGSGTITVDADGSETIDGDADQTLSQYSSKTFIDDGTGWIVI